MTEKEWMKTKELLFERYYRGTNTEESNIGTGLGLAITKQLVHAHNGTISVDSALGKGTTIILVFPFRCRKRRYVAPFSSLE